MYNSDHRTPATRLTGAAAALLAAGYALPALAAAWPPLRGPLGIEERTASGRGYALTFDDGPHALGTPAMLEILARSGPRATFFLVGEQVAKDPALAREIVAAGHGVGLHCHRHRNLLRLAPAQVRADVDRAQALIEDATAREVTLYRPPYGVLNAYALALARSHGWRTLLWTHWARDWEARATPASIAARVTERVSAGAVLLLHDADEYSAPGSWRRTAEALPRIIDTLAAQGLEPVAA
ncbi:MAG TPA: polysaccharide deacetylase family protein [Solirubrobacteraceae bacterium]|jgi:peptidoglycan/xylan/chitin deacetylase (PgdA/CDA1 family)|nr:polysaccharide deacetylase family protein [Solirubrobacteraceae bacterium]